MTAITNPSLFTPLLIFLLLRSLPPSIMAEPPSSDKTSSNTATPDTNISPTVEIICLVTVGLFFFTGFFFVSLRWMTKAGWCRPTSSGGPPRVPAPDGLALEAVQPQAVIPTYFYKDVKMHRRVGQGELECAVCLSEFEDNQALRLLPRCRHVFHPHCVEPWLASQATCPVCRAVLTPSKSNDSHRSGSGEPESSHGHPRHVLTIDVDPNSPLPRALDRSRRSDQGLTTEDGTIDRDEQLTLILPAEEPANDTWPLPSARSERKGFRGVAQGV